MVHIAADLSSHWIKTSVTLTAEILNKIQVGLVIVFFALSFIYLLGARANLRLLDGLRDPRDARQHPPGLALAPEAPGLGPDQEEPRLRQGEERDG